MPIDDGGKPPASPPALFPAIYLLPVAPHGDRKWGDPLLEALRRRLHEKWSVAFVAPTFSQLPWYSDHPTDRRLQQESYFVEDVVPWVERHYSLQAAPRGRLLLGFSKSGWGAWTLLLRRPKTFGAAAAWDAPLAMRKLGRFGTASIFATQQNFDAHCVSLLLSAAQTRERLGRHPRLILTGYDLFRDDHQEIHRRLEAAGVAHLHRDGPRRQHHWNSGWLAESVELLLEAARRVPADEP